jgi:hypothetical protein
MGAVGDGDDNVMGESLLATREGDEDERRYHASTALTC